jgi:peptidoglycan/LPS O-acetylase OafA/YrhL
MCDLEGACELWALPRFGQGQVLDDNARCGKGKAAKDQVMIDHSVISVGLSWMLVTLQQSNLYRVGLVENLIKSENSVRVCTTLWKLLAYIYIISFWQCNQLNVLSIFSIYWLFHLMICDFLFLSCNLLELAVLNLAPWDQQMHANSLLHIQFEKSCICDCLCAASIPTWGSSAPFLSMFWLLFYLCCLLLAGCRTRKEDKQIKVWGGIPP